MKKEICKCGKKYSCKCVQPKQLTTHPYEGIKNNPMYAGIPDGTEVDFMSQYFVDDTTPLFWSVLFSIKTIPTWRVIWGVKHTYSKLIIQNFRQYEFNLSEVEGFGTLNLYIKDSNHFFTPQDDYTYLHDGAWQKIPLTYKTLSKMKESEVVTIYFDFD
tara:strand:+ start:566 stop:1042 length:477 start_codon:yes stop_codon:yes gene_type:complete